ncbi:MAG: hypothetical protein JTT12_05650 [Candidatus Brockarchaeota archaeon]|nr:hypothetical protein [Candidatus Brockarchaeota archaeon]
MEGESRKGVIVKLDFHEARNTNARTTWAVVTANGETYDLARATDAKLINLVHSTYSPKKTHWFNYYEVSPEVVAFLRVRISNRNNISTQEFTVSQLVASIDELRVLDILTKTFW